jgi:UDP-glucose 4-epimerase
MAVRSLITGGAGFIGSYLAEELLSRNETVYILDELSTGNMENIDHLKNNSRFHYAIGSVHNEALISEIMDRCDIVYHLAAAVGVKLIVESPVNTIENNVHGTEIVLKVANKKKKKVLITSTSEVYGKSNAVPFREDQDLVLGPTTKGRWSYACSKAIDEFLAIAYWNEKKLPVVIVRLFNIVGPRQTGRYGMVIPSFVQQAISGQPITVYGDGTQSRAFSYVGDVVKAIADLAHHPDAVGEVFNIGNNREITMNDLAALVKRITGSSSEVVHVPYHEAYEKGFEDMPRRIPDISKAQRLVGFNPTVGLEDILRKIIADIRSREEKDQGILIQSA